MARRLRVAGRVHPRDCCADPAASFRRESEDGEIVAQVRATKPSKRGRIVRDPRVWGGEPTIHGTRVPVSSIVIEWQLTKDEQQVARAFPRVDLDAIREALAYYDSHREAIDRLIEENEEAASRTD